ncbi:glucosamine-6-phosphate deaminase [Escherichia coli]|nr:glucosamine-6-phosphate deaminase [Escherichia coli]
MSDITASRPEVDAPRDKRTYFREINYIAAAFQYQKKNYKSA